MPSRPTWCCACSMRATMPRARPRRGTSARPGSPSPARSEPGAVPSTMPLSKQDLADLKRAKLVLENPGLAAKLSNAIGSPVEKGMKMLPARWQKTVHGATEAALMKALDVAVSSLGEKAPSASRDKAHKFAAALSGAAGGAFGIAAIGIELPVSTTLILRSIADIAAVEGENPRQIETKLACLSVFALGSSRDASDNATESGYFAARSALATAVSEAAKHL